MHQFHEKLKLPEERECRGNTQQSLGDKILSFAQLQTIPQQFNPPILHQYANRTEGARACLALSLSAGEQEHGDLGWRSGSRSWLPAAVPASQVSAASSGFLPSQFEALPSNLQHSIGFHFPFDSR
ncbi:floral homeotic protein APETALA 2-like isoform X1 [Canna indica]|uniref:Floral homeotic protein APETALA 2-like isoform X1 n=1 Tax=Canna indica TaxID=4628 RepID=A0AAQ3QNC5_9LILI|nr:floral homeotic protein APETALA 2-like isoform X1 [Canna indica]